MSSSTASAHRAAEPSTTSSSGPIYVSGSNQTTSGLAAYFPATDTWASYVVPGPPSGVPLGVLGLVVVNGTLYVEGDGIYGNDTYLSDHLAVHAASREPGIG